MVAGTQIYGEIIIISQILEPTQIHSIGPNPKKKKIDVTPSPITAVSTSFVSLDPPGPIRNLRNRPIMEIS